MDDFLQYMEDALGLRVSCRSWDGTATLPMFLRGSASYHLCDCAGVEFVAAVSVDGEGLPALKRIAAQVSRHAHLPVVVVSQDADARKRRALTAQGIAFVVPYRQAYLPFLGLAATAEARRRAYGGMLTARGQAALVVIIAHPGMRYARELRELSGMGPSTVSRAIDELAQLGLIRRAKDGREVVFEYEWEGNALLRSAMPLLVTPVAKTVFARRDAQLDVLSDAGESALSSRSMLAPPAIAQKAVARREFPSLRLEEVLEGELADADTVELQVWRYDPLVAGLGEVDSVSLGASLMGLGDERVSMELDGLFGEEDLWP